MIRLKLSVTEYLVSCKKMENGWNGYWLYHRIIPFLYYKALSEGSADDVCAYLVNHEPD